MKFLLKKICVLLLCSYYIFNGFSETIALSNSQNYNLIGTKDGLFSVYQNKYTALWNGAPIYKIIHTDAWYFLTGWGILYSTDLENFEFRNNNLPVQVLKHYDGETATFINRIKPLKDFEILPDNPNIMVTATKDEVFITYNNGHEWHSLGFGFKTSGLKSIGLASLKNEQGEKQLTVFLSHAMYGLAYIYPEATRPKWEFLAKGIEKMPTISESDEIADIKTVLSTDSNGNEVSQVFFTQTFLPRLYKLDWQEKKAVLIASTDNMAETWDGLTLSDNSLIFSGINKFYTYDLRLNTLTPTLKNYHRIKDLIKSEIYSPLSAYFSPLFLGSAEGVSFSELWLQNAGKIDSPYSKDIQNKKSLYVPSGQVRTTAGINKYLKLIKDNELNSLVIDMKDDYGLLRYKTSDALVQELGKVSAYALDINEFIKKFKEKGIYLIARIVVFKDRTLYSYKQGKYATFDKKTKKPWLGIKTYEKQENDDGTTTSIPVYYDEYWVDPYSENVWEYNVAIAKELINLGFNEIQFDYIRFPTDGQNLYNATYRYRDTKMDMEGALLSFLAYARENINAPIALDIYGANGWYRSGARTGQDVDQMSEYVDVFAPMFYPSHFEQIFLAYTPVIERPYRIYYFGTYRNSIIARNKSVIRPWVQAFYLNVSFDQQFYDKDYVLRQVQGVRDATNSGYMYWNNSGRYNDIQPDTNSLHNPTEQEKKAAEYSSVPLLPVKG